jgi:glycerol-1-phosphate dehydrogenase [NAD(P)+]
MTDVLHRLLNGKFVDADTGAALSVPTRSVVIERSLKGHEAALLRELELGGRLAVVSDPVTHEVLGDRVERAAGSIATVQSIVLPDKPKADAGMADEIRHKAAEADALVAVGSGTINDLCKFASARAGKPYAVFATAPSMNGYTSVNAAITEKGHKKSLQAQGAAGVFIDLEIFAAAPPRMIRSGLGDSLCRPTAQADWLLAGRLFGAPYRRAPFDLLAEDEERLFAEPEGLLRKDLGVMECLARTLCLSGFGMTICGGSYPASQGEHLIAHYIEMMAGASLPSTFHGEQIAVTTLTMARLQQAFLGGPPPVLRSPAVRPSDFEKRYGKTTGQSCWEEFAKKRLDGDKLEATNGRLRSEWHDITTEIERITVPAETLRGILKRIDGPTTAEDIALSAAFYRNAVIHAREIRDRFTFLDLAADSGHFDTGLML